MKYDQDKYPMIWKRTPKVGYCFTAMIPCRLLRKAGKRVEIAALLGNGGERVHRVTPESLKHDPCRCLSGCRVLKEFLEMDQVLWTCTVCGKRYRSQTEAGFCCFDEKESPDPVSSGT